MDGMKVSVLQWYPGWSLICRREAHRRLQRSSCWGEGGRSPHSISLKQECRPHTIANSLFFEWKKPAAFSSFMLDRTPVMGDSYENASGIFMRRAFCEMYQYCFHFVCMRPDRESCGLIINAQRGRDGSFLAIRSGSPGCCHNPDQMSTSKRRIIPSRIMTAPMIRRIPLREPVRH